MSMIFDLPRFALEIEQQRPKFFTMYRFLKMKRTRLNERPIWILQCLERDLRERKIQLEAFKGEQALNGVNRSGSNIRTWTNAMSANSFGGNIERAAPDIMIGTISKPPSV